MKLPKISIVTPSFNQGDFIEETICSVLDQGYENLEYIIIDGGSTDNSVDIIKKYEKHLHYWVSEKDSGQTEAINKGFARCSGDVFNWLNSDDYLSPGALDLIGQHFTKSELLVLSARENFVGANGELLGTSKGTTVFDDFTSTFASFHIDQPVTYFRRDALASIFPLNESIHYLMDAEFWMRFLGKYGTEEIVKIDDTIVNFRMHDQSKTVSQQDKFLLDRNAIENGFLRAAKIKGHDEVERLLLSRQQSIEYTYNGNVPHFDEAVLLSHYAARSIEQFYVIGEYESAKMLARFVNKHKPQLVLNNPLLKKICTRLKLPNPLLNLKDIVLSKGKRANS